MKTLKALRFADASAAPLSQVNGDSYVITDSRSALDIDTIAWQSGHKVRLTFNSTPNLSTYAVGDYITIKNAIHAENNGTFLITGKNYAGTYLEYTNTAISSAAYNEGTDCLATATSTKASWDGSADNSFVTYNESSDSWEATDLEEGDMCYSKHENAVYFFNGSEWGGVSSYTAPVEVSLAAGVEVGDAEIEAIDQLVTITTEKTVDNTDPENPVNVYHNKVTLPPIADVDKNIVLKLNLTLGEDVSSAFIYTPLAEAGTTKLNGLLNNYGGLQDNAYLEIKKIAADEWLIFGWKRASGAALTGIVQQ